MNLDIEVIMILFEYSFIYLIFEKLQEILTTILLRRQRDKSQN